MPCMSWVLPAKRILALHAHVNRGSGETGALHEGRSVPARWSRSSLRAIDVSNNSTSSSACGVIRKVSLVVEFIIT
jgi:hypothetical protein